MKTLVMMGGGANSTAMVYKLKQAGHEVIKRYMKPYGKSEYHEESIAKVEKVAKLLQILYHILDLQKDSKAKVYIPFIDACKEDKTPNPCVLRNRLIKLGKLLESAKSLGCEKLVTRHYVRFGNSRVKAAADGNKDQSYFLANVNREALQYLISPLGEMKKEDVKKLASTVEVLKSLATQKESSKICFAENTYVDVLKQFMDTKVKGEMLDSNGKIVGEHNGYMHYTIGKRRSFEVRSAYESHFVLRINPKESQIVVGMREELKTKEFKLGNINLFTDEKAFDCEVKIRYRLKSMPCEVLANENLNVQISLKESVYGLASGQATVFYEEDRVIAGGFIS